MPTSPLLSSPGGREAAAAGRPPPSGGGELEPPSSGPPSTLRRFVRPREPGLVETYAGRLRALVGHHGQVAKLLAGALRATFRRPFELRETIRQMEILGARSLGIASVVAVFTGLVMAVQFAYGLQKFGGIEYTGRIIGLSFARELAPSLTSLVVGGRIGAGITAELGSMAVTEQIDAIAALGADPVKKLVVPRLYASILVMPVLAAFALVLGFAGAMLITAAEFGLSWQFFLNTALESVRFADFLSGMVKTPFFGAIIALVGCHFGMTTRGGTEGVGSSTTRSVVTISIAILISDFVLTKITMLLWPSGA
ncbi:MAG: ABC transporter permease [Deltaproteobacteria bacterium]|nr:ABC transporter permease [Deltaproteobacteria bacterium]